MWSVEAPSLQTAAPGPGPSVCLSGMSPETRFLPTSRPTRHSRPWALQISPGPTPSMCWIQAPPPQSCLPRFRPHTSVFSLQVTQSPFPHSRFLLLSDLTWPCPLTALTLGSSPFPLLTQPRRPSRAPTRPLSRPHCLPFPAPPTQRLGSGPAPPHRAH